MNHSFDIEHAQLFGLPESILISNLQFWISKNAANGVHQHEGRTWTYNSAKAFAALFPYLSDRQIRRTIDSLTDQAVVMKGNYNASACDRTLWLAFVDEDSFLTVKKPAPNSANGAPKKSKPAPNSANGCADSGESLIEQIVNTDSKQERESAYAPPLPIDLLNDWTAVRKAKKAGPITKTVMAGIAREAEKANISLIEAVTACCEFGWQGFNAQWYAERTNGKPAAMTASNRQPESFAERDARNKREEWERMTNRSWPAEDLPGARPAAPLVIDITANEPRRIS